jgi:hypothetical protein
MFQASTIPFEKKVFFVVPATLPAASGLMDPLHSYTVKKVFDIPVHRGREYC